MKKINLKNNISYLSNDHQKKNVYYREKLNKETARKFADDFFSKLGVSIDDRQTDEYEDTIIYNATGYNLWIEFQDGSYRLSNNIRFERMQNTEPVTGLSREQVLEALNKVNIVPPTDAKFSEDNGRYYFTINCKYII